MAVFKLYYVKVENNLRLGRLDFGELNARRIEHSLGCVVRLSAVVLIGEIYDLLYARLNDGLSTFVTGEEGDEDSRADERLSARIEYCVELCVYYEVVLGLTE